MQAPSLTPPTGLWWQPLATALDRRVSRGAAGAVVIRGHLSLSALTISPRGFRTDRRWLLPRAPVAPNRAAQVKDLKSTAGVAAVERDAKTLSDEIERRVRPDGRAEGRPRHVARARHVAADPRDGRPVRAGVPGRPAGRARRRAGRQRRRGNGRHGREPVVPAPPWRAAGGLPAVRRRDRRGDRPRQGAPRRRAVPHRPLPGGAPRRLRRVHERCVRLRVPPRHDQRRPVGARTAGAAPARRPRLSAKRSASRTRRPLATTRSAPRSSRRASCTCC